MSQPEGCRLDFVDTNVVLDAVVREGPLRSAIERFLRRFRYRELKVAPVVMGELNRVIARVNNAVWSALEGRLVRNPRWIGMDREDRLEYLGQIRDRLVDDVIARVSSRDAEIAQGYVKEFVNRALEEYEGHLSLIRSEDDLKLLTRLVVSLAPRLVREQALTLFEHIIYSKDIRPAVASRQLQILRALVTGSGGKCFSSNISDKGDAAIVAQLLALLEHPPPAVGQCGSVRAELWTRDERFIKCAKRLRDLDVGITPRPKFEDLLVRHPLRDDV
jgi:predicted nucleic acid-binding protein